MFTAEEVDRIGEDNLREATNRVLEDAMVYGGRIDIGCMERSQIDYAIHLLRQFKARMPEISQNRPIEVV